MPSCVVKWCKNNSTKWKKSDGITFHRFPTNLTAWDSWVTVIRKIRGQPDWLPSKGSVLCSLHFKENDLYTTANGYLRVSKNAVPIMSHPSHARSKRPKAKHIVPEYSDEDIQEVGDDDISSKWLLENNDASNPEKTNLLRTQASKTQPFASSSRDGEVWPETSEVTYFKNRNEPYVCNMCKKDILRGFRYVCVQCADFDLCSSCEATGEHSHHYVLRLPRLPPQPHQLVQGNLGDVLCTIRRMLITGMHLTLKAPSQDIEVKMPVKEEVPDDPLDIMDSCPETCIVPDVDLSEEGCCNVTIGQELVVKLEPDEYTYTVQTHVPRSGRPADETWLAGDALAVERSPKLDNGEDPNTGIADKTDYKSNRKRKTSETASFQVYTHTGLEGGGTRSSSGLHAADTQTDDDAG